MSARAHGCHRLRVAEVITETDDACSIVFAVPPELTGQFGYKPGQFLTVRVPAADGPGDCPRADPGTGPDGDPGDCPRDGSVARCYSLSSSPHTGDRPAITVKRAGYASGWLLDNLRAGSVLDVLPPAGTFTPRSLDANLLLFAGGSGITPVMSIVKSALARGRGQIVVVYANRDERSVIFAAQLRRLAAASPRLLVLHWLDSLSGPPAAATLAALAGPYRSYEAFLCGPEPYMNSAREALGQLGVPAARIHAERFVSLADNPFAERPAAQAEGGMAATLEVSMDGENRVLRWPAGARMLDVLIDEGLDAPFSCREGVCGACACQLTDGEVKMAHNDVLDEADIADGYILACQALPLCERVRVKY